MAQEVDNSFSGARADGPQTAIAAISIEAYKDNSFLANIRAAAGGDAQPGLPTIIFSNDEGSVEQKKQSEGGKAKTERR